MDQHSRTLSRTRDQGADELVSSLVARLRSGERVWRPGAGRLVGGPALARVLEHLLETGGQREVEVLREQPDLDPKHHCRWIRAFRDLLRGTPRSWVWVERWAELLGFDLDLLALAAETRLTTQG